MKSLALIPARGGSQRVPHKNIRPFHGRPIIEYSIETAQRSGLFDRIVISTDDPAIADVARRSGAEVPFMRPAELADHKALPITSVLHAIRELQASGATYDNICILFATAPFVRVEDLASGLALLSEPNVPCVLPVTDFGFPIFRALKMIEGGALEMFWPEHETTRSNDLPTAYHDAGQFVWMKTDIVLREKRFYVPGMRALVLPRHRVQDIDTEEDWTRAEHLYALLEQKSRC
jgi:pseudaminic acid cytidylyltransferase